MTAPAAPVHGIRRSTAMRRPHLAPDHRVTAPDLPGHGALADR
ncbi:hypothetical protein [Kitasatospora sp. CB01950]|nr:hypothetical protein [Kitasatospora sp. CB01950]